MTKEDLIFLKPKGDPRSDAIRAKIKGSASQRRKDAQKLSAIKRKIRNSPEKIDEDTLRWITDSRYSASRIILFIKEILQAKLTKNQQIMLLGKLIETQRALHPPVQKQINLGKQIVEVKFVDDNRWGKEKSKTQVVNPIKPVMQKKQEEKRTDETIKEK